MTNNIKKSKNELIKFLFNEELGGVFAIDKKNEKEFSKLVRKYKLDAITHKIGTISNEDKPKLNIGSCNYSKSLSVLRKYWSELSYLIQTKEIIKKLHYQNIKRKLSAIKVISP